jgi:hypothetical protein
MSNLSDLLPAGGSGKTVELVASGALSNGDKVVLQSDGTVKVVAEGPATLGSEASTFTGNNGFSVSMLTPTTFVGGGRDSDNSGNATCVIGTISGTEITFGTPVSAGIGSTTEKLQVQAISATQFVVVWGDWSDTNKGKAVGATVSGNSITFGTTVIFESGQTSFNSERVCTPLSDTQFVIAFEDASDLSKAKAIVGTINSSNALSFGTAAVTATPNSSKYSVVSKLTSTKIVIAWSDTPSTERGMVRIGTVSGTSISFGSAQVYDTPYIVRHSIAALSDTTFVIAYQYDRYASNSIFIGKAIIGSVSGTTITLGTPTAFTSHNLGNHYPSVVKISESEFGIVYRGPTPTNYGTLIIGSVTGTSITYDTPIAYSSTYVTNFYSTYSAPRLVIGYDLTDFTSIVYSLVSTNLTATNLLGIAQATVADTATVEVETLGGLATNLSGLTIGSKYYVQDDGTITTSSAGQFLGRAITATTINMKDFT